ncbi:aminodeoxychorismate lyase [Vibrio ziniensis]|uniref:Aminodeoxychorismate lyase n=1 Tax=Vibrio ziniensis TaxID=2711221 RepID=A0A6G7CJQ9_9VIBR|nr:aminodeoxychorismate lyase [Vibrio ziniensis]QIH42283.1 aminodeoxychorismate lyase [Vibrio ziniensis]
MVWVNGELSELIAVSDRSFQYGDGCFTTMLTKHGEIQHWPHHIERMNACLKMLGIFQPNWQQVEQWLQLAILPDAKAGVKIHISRGMGGRGYSPAHVTQPNVTISNFAFPSHYAQWQAEGLQLGICSKRMGLNPMLAGHKHNNRLEQVLLKSEMDQAGYFDGLCLDINGHIVETTAANIFWLKGATLYTPSLKNAGVAGVARRNILEYAHQLKLKVVKGDFELDHLDNAEEIFISNSLLEVAPVVQISEHKYSIGQQTLRIQEKFNS